MKKPSLTPSAPLLFGLLLAACGGKSEFPSGEAPGLACTADGESCQNAADCCVGVCIAGTCGACKVGEPAIVLASGEEFADPALDKEGMLRIAVDDTAVYWGSTADLGGIRKVDKRSGAPVTLAAGVLNPWSLVVDHSHVYFSCEADPVVKKVPTSGGDVVTLFGPSPGTRPFRLAQDEERVYWTSLGSAGVTSVLKDGGALATMPPGDDDGWAIAIDGDRIYWSGTGQIVSAPKSGGDAEVLAQFDATDIAVDEEYLYFTDSDSIRRVPKAGGLPEGLSQNESPANVALDKDHVYWGSAGAGGSGAVRKIAKPANGSGSVADVVDIWPDETPSVVAVDETCIYWLNLDGEVLKVHK